MHAVREGKCSTISGTSLLRRVQVENRFRSVKIFITIHQPKNFLSPTLWTRTKACLLLLDETYSFRAPCLPLFAVSCTSIRGPLCILQAFSRQVRKCCLLSYTLVVGIRSQSSLPTRKERMHTYYVTLDSSPN